MRKGIILAGGKGNRLHPITKVISKQLVPVFDKPLIFYPLSTLIQLGIKEILIICVPSDLKYFKKLINTLELKGIKIIFKIQKKPNGLPEAFKIGKKFIGNSAVTLILGDNIFYNKNLGKILQKYLLDINNASIFVKKVKKPNDFGVITKIKKRIHIQEKPKKPKSRNAITGLYFFPNDVCKFASFLEPSSRGETEITDLIKKYIDQSKINIVNLKNTIWLDTGTPERLLKASNLVYKLKKQKGLSVGNLK